MIRRQVVTETSVLNQPLDRGEDVRPVVRRVRSAEGGFGELEGAVKRSEEEDDVLVPSARVVVAVEIDGGEGED